MTPEREAKIRELIAQGHCSVALAFGLKAAAADLLAEIDALRARLIDEEKSASEISIRLAAAEKERDEAKAAERARCLAIIRKAQDDVSERSATASVLGEIVGGIQDGDDPRYFVPTQDDVQAARDEAESAYTERDIHERMRSEAEAKAEAAEARAASLAAEVERLREALRPFAKADEDWVMRDDDTVSIVGEVTLIDALAVGDFRRAAALLAPQKEEARG